jgi:hypothetical protein
MDSGSGNLVQAFGKKGGRMIIASIEIVGHSICGCQDCKDKMVYHSLVAATDATSKAIAKKNQPAIDVFLNAQLFLSVQAGIATKIPQTETEPEAFAC